MEDSTRKLRAIHFKGVLAAMLVSCLVITGGCYTYESVVICDEAGLKSNRQGAELFRLAHKHNMRVLLVGDVRQHISSRSRRLRTRQAPLRFLRDAIRLSGVFAYPRRKDFVHIDGLLAVHGTRSVCLEHLYLATFKDDETLS